MLMHNKERGELLKAGLGGGESVEDEPSFAKFDYYLDESDPDVVILRRQDGAFVAAFSAQGATLREADRGQRRPFGSSKRGRAKEERITLERPYSLEFVEGVFSEVGCSPIHAIFISCG
jgi:hypothetical protein